MNKQDDPKKALPITHDVMNAAARSQPSKTPMYEAIHSARYERQELIKNIRETYGRQLVCYVCGAAALINRDDTVFFVDLLHNVTNDGDLDLLLHTSGGDIDAAEKLADFRRGNDLFRDFSFDTISGAGSNGAIVHYRVSPESNRPIRPGDAGLAA